MEHFTYHPSMYGRTHTSEARKRIGASQRGRKPSEETRKLWSQQRSGSGNGRARPIQCVETQEVFNCATDARKKYGKINLHSALTVGQTAAGYHWVYYETLPS